MFYTDNNEQKLYKDLSLLFCDWKKQVSIKGNLIIDDGEYAPLDLFETDGFYPGYLSSEKRVLFIGREPRWEPGQDRIGSDIEKWKKSKPEGSFWRRVFYILYGIEHSGNSSFQEAERNFDEYVKSKIANQNYGFGLMNLSKYANLAENSGTKASRYLIKRFIDDSELDLRNYFMEEINLLKPDIIITMNIFSYFRNEEIFPNLEDTADVPHRSGSVDIFVDKDEKYYVFDTEHFSNMTYSDQNMYEKIMEAYNKYIK